VKDDRRAPVKSENRPRHITKGDVFDDLGLSRSEASALKVKATLLDAIRQEIEKQGYTQSQLVEILDEYQPSVSKLTRGKIAKVSVEKLLTYSRPAEDEDNAHGALQLRKAPQERFQSFKVSRFQGKGRRRGGLTLKL
jgi:predicted XRE-type DNA-binding protein